MSIAQIRDSWNQGAMKGNSPAHKNFPDQMAMKTVIKRACKLLVRGSDDAVLYENEDRQISSDRVSEDVNQDIKENANKEEIGFADIEDAKYEEVKDEPTPSETEKELETAGPSF